MPSKYVARPKAGTTSLAVCGVSPSRSRAGGPGFGAVIDEAHREREETQLVPAAVVLFRCGQLVEYLEATWGIYQRMIAAYWHPDPAAGRELRVKLIESLSAGVPRPLVEIAKLGRTLSKRAADVLACFDRPGTSNGPTEAINGRLEHLRGSALGFRNLTNYIARSLLETGGFRPRLHPALVKSRSSWGRPRYDGNRQPVILS